MSDLTVLESLEHYCFTGPTDDEQHAVCRLFCPPTQLVCSNCGASYESSIAAQIARDGNCPRCGNALEGRPGKKIGQVHARLCTDKYRHYPEMHRDGKISDKEYVDWKASLTREEKLGVYRRRELHPITVDLSENEVQMIDRSPSDFSNLVDDYLKARAEHALRHEIPFKNQPGTRKLKVEHLRKNP